MSYSEAQSLAYYQHLYAQNQSAGARQERVNWRGRLDCEGGWILHECIDARVEATSTLDSGEGPVLQQRGVFGGTTSPDHWAAFMNGGNIRGNIFIAHFDPSAPDSLMGYGGCGARSAAALFQTGGSLPLTGAELIRDEVDPHFIRGPLTRAEETSQHSRAPSVAMGIDHCSQRAYLFGVAQDGRWKHVVSADLTGGVVPEIQPEEVQDVYPDVAAMIRQGRIFSATQTTEEIEGRRIQNPPMVWVTQTALPTWNVWGEAVGVGNVMRITYPRHSQAKEYSPRKGAAGLVCAHLSYAFAQASSGGHGFEDTNLLVVDGKTPAAVHSVWNAVKPMEETRQWLGSGQRVVMGVVMRSGSIEHCHRIH
ncbi:hypothetical protein KBB12_04415 [Candidatus Woesebacteria bacterium]|nr:hypothetical protein [Candidatus Woesebacteria bacterium]